MPMVLIFLKAVVLLSYKQIYLAMLLVQEVLFQRAVWVGVLTLLCTLEEIITNGQTKNGILPRLEMVRHCA
jgi:hypothetical protein